MCCLLGFGGGGAQTPSSSFYPPPPFPLAHADQLINSILKKAKQKVFDPLTSEETRNADSVFSIVRAHAFGYHHELLDCQQINQSVYSICCHSKHSLGP